jgi:hypothetical protein
MKQLNSFLLAGALALASSTAFAQAGTVGGVPGGDSAGGSPSAYRFAQPTATANVDRSGRGAYASDRSVDWMSTQETSGSAAQDDAGGAGSRIVGGGQ